MIREAGLIAMPGQLIDVSVVAAPKRRNIEVELVAIRKGTVPEA